MAAGLGGGSLGEDAPGDGTTVGETAGGTVLGDTVSAWAVPIATIQAPINKKTACLIPNPFPALPVRFYRKTRLRSQAAFENVGRFSAR